MRRNVNYENEKFSATRRFVAIDIYLADLTKHFVIAIGLEGVRQYDEQGILNYCIDAVKPLSKFSQLMKVEIVPGEAMTVLFFGFNEKISKEEAKGIANAFGGALMEPINEEIISGEVRTHVEVATDRINDLFKW